MTARLTPQEALKIRREARFGRFKDILFGTAGAGIGVTLALGVFFSTIFLFDALNEFDYEEYQREQKLMECLKEAKNRYSASFCQVNWGPEDKDKDE